MAAFVRKIRCSLAWWSAGALLALATPSAVAQNTIQACRDATNGNLRQVSAPSDCRRNEVPVSWNIVGPMGPQGPRGSVGATGPMGPVGLTGATGPMGATGSIGPAGPVGPAGNKTVVGSVSVTNPLPPIVPSCAPVIGYGGFTCYREGPGQYSIAFPAGTFSTTTPIVPIVMPLITAPGAVNIAPGYNQFGIRFESGQDPDAFAFIVAQIP